MGTEKEKQLEQAEIKTEKVEKAADVKENIFKQFEGLGENRIRQNSVFNQLASAELNAELAKGGINGELVAGGNPTAKYLKQEIMEAPCDRLTEMLFKMIPNKEFVELGKGVEYSLVNNNNVACSLDPDQFTPESDDINDIDNMTYWDSIDLPEVGKDTPKTMITKRMYRYLPYFLNGKVEVVAGMVEKYLQQTMDIKMAKELLNMVQLVQRYIAGLDKSTEAKPTKNIEGTATTILSAIKEINLIVNDMTYPNQTYALGKVNGLTEEGGLDVTPWTDGFSCIKKGDELLITTAEIYENMKAQSLNFMKPEDVRSYFNMDRWVLLPKSMLSVSGHTVAGDRASLESVAGFTDKDGNVVHGRVLITSKQAFRCLYNYDTTSAVWYQSNNSTQLEKQFNYIISGLKFSQVALYTNTVLESEMVYNVKEVNK